MVDRAAAERACKDPNPIIDGRKANVNLAYLGAKPRSSQTSTITAEHALFRLLVQIYNKCKSFLYDDDRLKNPNKSRTDSFLFMTEV